MIYFITIKVFHGLSYIYYLGYFIEIIGLVSLVN